MQSISNKTTIPLVIISISISISSFAGTQIGGSGQIANGGDGTICTANTGLSLVGPSTNRYNCIIAAENGALIITNVTKNESYPNNTELAAAISNSATNSIVIGKNAHATNIGDIALGNNSKTTAVTQTASVIIANQNYEYAGKTPTNAVSVGEAGKERVIQSVAAGRISADSTDAVNGSQLYAAHQAIDVIYQKQMAGYDSQISKINQDLDQLKEGAYAGIAGAMAIGSLPQPSAPGKSMISGGMGTYKGHSAAAFGFSSVSEDDKVIWKMGASFDTNRNSGGTLSLGYQW